MMTNSRLSVRTLTVAVACTVFAAVGIFAFPTTWSPIEFVFAAVYGFANVDTEKTIDPMAVSPAAAFTAGNLVVYRVGTGAAPLDSTATAVFLDEYTSAGTLVQSVALPTTTSGSNRRFTASGSATSEGLLTRSTDGRYLVLAGYDAATGTPSVGSTTSAAVNRVIARIGVDGTIDTTTALTDAASGNSPRGVAATDGSGYWLTGGAGGVRYGAAGGPTSIQLSTTVADIRGVGILGSQLLFAKTLGPTAREEEPIFWQVAGLCDSDRVCFDLMIELGADTIVMFHPHYQYPPALVSPMVSLLGHNVCPVSLGSRRLGNGAA